MPMISSHYARGCFNPSLLGRPVVVLSNNDGCVIARSDEAGKLGIKMDAMPALPCTDEVALCV